VSSEAVQGRPGASPRPPRTARWP